MKKQILTPAFLMLSALVFSSGTFAEMDHSLMANNAMEHDQMEMGSMDMNGMKNTSAVGMQAKGATPTKVIQVILADDMTITFKGNSDIKPNDVVQFVVMNTGKMTHEFVIGNHKEQLAYREMMKQMNGNTMADGDNSVTVAPGKAKQITWHFHGEKEVEFACNIPGHAEAGMMKTINL